MTREEQRRRDEQIALQRIQGVSELELADAYRVNVRTVRRAYRRWKDGGFRVENIDAIAEIGDHLLKTEHAISELAREGIEASSSPVRVRALLAKHRLAQDRIRILMDVGIVPRAADDRLKDVRRDHAGQFAYWIPRYVGHELREMNVEDEVVAGINELIRAGVRDWLERAPRGLWSEKQDTFTPPFVR